jgi:GH18 family chitinase
MSNNALAPGWTETSLFPKMAAWKNINPNIKISMSVGGWTEGVFNLIKQMFYIIYMHFHCKIKKVKQFQPNRELTRQHEEILPIGH